MDNKTLIFGHKNPDTDSVAAAISLSHLKNSLGEDTQPFILNDINRETKFVLDYFGVESPEKLKDVRIQVKDLDYDRTKPFEEDRSILDAYSYMSDSKIRTLPIVSTECRLSGIVTMKDIVMSLIQKDQRKLCTSYENILCGMEAEEVYRSKDHIEGNIIVTAYHLKTIEHKDIFKTDSVVIVGDRDDVIEAAIEKKVELILITGNGTIRRAQLEKAKKSGVSVLKTRLDTYEASKKIFLTNYVSSIMIKENIMFFEEGEYLDECRELIRESRHSKFPVLDADGRYLGMLGREHIINPKKKKVILVDHNEYSQSADGIRQAEILEVIDHHKIGDITTSLPISFRNYPVGSSNTIIYQMYKEENVAIPYEIAGIMLSGIISDTLLFKSPTTTKLDVDTANELKDMLDLDVREYAMAMFKKGTDISGKAAEEVFFSDYKEFTVDGLKVGISQVFTLNIESIKGNIELYSKLIEDTSNQREQFITLLAVTDIIEQGSYLFYNRASERIIEGSFKIAAKQGVFIENCVSRKKQIVPILMEGMRNLK